MIHFPAEISVILIIQFQKSKHFLKIHNDAHKICLGTLFKAHVEGKNSFSVLTGVHTCNRRPPMTKLSISTDKFATLRKKNAGQINFGNNKEFGSFSEIVLHCLTLF